MKLAVVAVLLLVLASCGKPPVDKIRKSGSPGDLKAFDTYLYNDPPKQGDNYHFFISPGFNEFGTQAEGNTQRFASRMVMFLHPNHKFNLFYNVHMLYKNKDGSYCVNEKKELRNFRIYKNKVEGNWTVQGGNLVLFMDVDADKNTKKRIPLAHAAKVPMGGLNGIEVALDEELSYPHMKEAKHVLGFYTDNTQDLKYYMNESEPVMNPGQAQKELEKLCKDKPSDVKDIRAAEAAASSGVPDRNSKLKPSSACSASPATSADAANSGDTTVDTNSAPSGDQKQTNPPPTVNDNGPGSGE